LKILGIDIGAGTTDVLLYDSKKKIENCIKMVLPSSTILYAKKVSELESDLYIDGFTIGGGSLKTQLKDHITKGYSVSMSEQAAYSLYNRLSRVESLGITFTEKVPPNFQGAHVTLDEVNIEPLRTFLKNSCEYLDDLQGVTVSVQDHGVPTDDIPQNTFRMVKFKEQFTQNHRIYDALFSTDIPEYYLRMKAAVESVKKALPHIRVWVMDSTIAAILGCLYDNPQPLSQTEPMIVVNIGNSHITAAVVENERIIGLMEHHTSLLVRERLERFLERLGSGLLTDDEVTSDGGHGAFYLSKPTKNVTRLILVTGPNRLMMKGSKWKVHFAAPSGDVMMTGVYGMVKTVEKMLLVN
jgi:uncharacterized protein (DUF1786 family)